MPVTVNKRLFTAATALGVLIILSAWMLNVSGETIDFSTQVKPIINEHCITCHGGVKAKADFSLLFRAEALAKTKSGKPAIIPGDADASEMIRRLTLDDPEERMPYEHEPLPKEKINILRKWIDQGAKWGEHWAYKPLTPVEVPQHKSFFGLINTKNDWANNEVDNFIAAKFKKAGLQPSAQADKATLLRRVSLDITGMQPAENVALAFLNSNNPNAYDILVDSLLASKHFGEKWASMWLDLARYADTKGYEADIGRNIWQYRDWVIEAFNRDMPYDSFLIKQLAGDLLPEPTDADYIATAFHRNSMTNDEGGTDNEEFRLAAVMDRVNTTWTAVMGTTFSCVQCHAHPYDPFRYEDYYSFLAFFNNSRDEDTEADYPLLRQYSSPDSNKLSTLINWLQQNTSKEQAKEYYTFLKTWQPSVNSLQCDSFENAALVSSWYAGIENNGHCRLPNIMLSGKEELLFRYTSSKKGGVWSIRLDSLNGRLLASVPLSITRDWKISSVTIPAVEGYHNLYLAYTNPNLEVEETGVLFDWFSFKASLPGKGKEGYTNAYNTFWELMNARVTTTPIMIDNPGFMSRTSYVFERGNWMVKGDKIAPGVPASLNPLPGNAPKNRLGLALWVTSKQNPLTARTMVNRVWEQLFGTGLAETLEDLGTQGIPPTHMELLDYLAYRFMTTDQWRIKKLVRQVVTSATYKQDSRIAPGQEQKDPQNNYYARAPRLRLSSEQVRDQSLCISGLICDKMYGPGVMPYQPKGVWLSPYNGASWVQSTGEDQYRRAVYTYWKRSAAYPSMLSFDGVSREVCTARRIRTNTPLQALTTLNDSAFIEAARHFAYRMQEVQGDEKIWISRGYKLATYKDIDAKSLHALQQLYSNARGIFKKDNNKLCEISGGMGNKTNAETAALIIVANAILNLDEVVTKN